ncbi:hypothetical protein [Micromonospora sp. DT47]|uniref:hypothetical protein n=1 Tax=Micromonospora sp. DT47 TaxID=3393431 RepID=UPI003CFBAB05
MRADHLSRPLEQVSQRAVGRGEPIWSALVVGSKDWRPLKGFYALARQLRPEYADLADSLCPEHLSLAIIIR